MLGHSISLYVLTFILKYYVFLTIVWTTYSNLFLNMYHHQILLRISVSYCFIVNFKRVVLVQPMFCIKGFLWHFHYITFPIKLLRSLSGKKLYMTKMAMTWYFPLNHHNYYEFATYKRDCQLDALKANYEFQFRFYSFQPNLLKRIDHLCHWTPKFFNFRVFLYFFEHPLTNTQERKPVWSNHKITQILKTPMNTL